MIVKKLTQDQEFVDVYKILRYNVEFSSDMVSARENLSRLYEIAGVMVSCEYINSVVDEISAARAIATLELYTKTTRKEFIEMQKLRAEASEWIGELVEM